MHRLVTEYQQRQPALLYLELTAAMLLDGSRRNTRWPVSSVWKSIEDEIRLQSTEIEGIHILEMDEGGYIVLLKLSSSSSLLLQHYILRQIAGQMLVTARPSHQSGICSTLPSTAVRSSMAKGQQSLMAPSCSSPCSR